MKYCIYVKYKDRLGRECQEFWSEHKDEVEACKEMIKQCEANATSWRADGYWMEVWHCITECDEFSDGFVTRKVDLIDKMVL